MEKGKNDLEVKEDESAPDIPPIEDMTSTGNNSRLSRMKTSQMKRNITLTIIGLLVLAIVTFLLGPTLIIQFSILLDKAKNPTEQSITEEKEEYLAPPTLNKVPSATKEPTISVSGNAGEKQTVELYVNESLVDKTVIKSGDEFTFQNVNLRNGENTIQAKAVLKKTKSELSNTQKITYREKAPDLEITNPHDGDAFTGDQPTLRVTGKTASYAKVTINDAWAIMDDEGNFHHSFVMQSGENKLMIVATDEAGNKTEKEVKFNYAP